MLSVDFVRTAWRWARRAARSTALAIGGSLGSGRVGAGVSLMYHRVSPAPRAGEAWGNRSLSVSVDAFDEQVRFFSENYTCLALPEAVGRLREGQLPQGTVVFTFDDGYRDNLELALPVLEKWGVPATIYVATGLVDRPELCWWFELEALVRSLTAIDVELPDGRLARRMRTSWDCFAVYQRLARCCSTVDPAVFAPIMDAVRRQAPGQPDLPSQMMSWGEIRQIDAHPLITIGAHTVSHPPLGALTEADATGELEESKAVLERELGHAVDHLAYPYGSVFQIGEREVELARQAGFASSFTTRQGHLMQEHADHLLALPRLQVADGDTLGDIRWTLSGLAARVRGDRPPVTL